MQPQKKTSKDRQQHHYVNPSVDFTRKLKMEFCHHFYCMADGAKFAYKRAQNELKLTEDGQTTADGSITLDKTTCLGHCGHGPNLKVSYLEDNKTVILEKMNAFKVGEMTAPYRARQKRKSN